MDELHIKDYDTWNDRKKALNSKMLPPDFFFLEREIWWASLGVNVAKEMDGKHNRFERPVLVLKKFSEDTLWILPITSTNTVGEYFHKISHKKVTGTIPLLQLRMISAHRLLRLVMRIDEEEFMLIRNKIVHLLLKNETPPALGDDFATVTGI